MVMQHGDPVPAALAAYLHALDAGLRAEAVEQFSPDVRYAVPPSEVPETGPRRVAHGREELLAWFVERGPAEHEHEVRLCVDEGPSCLVEGVTVHRLSGRPLATFAASLQLDADGLINRYLAFIANPPVDPAPDGSGAAPGDAVDVLRRYFEALDAGAFADAADQFSADVVYSHPPYRHTGIDSDERVVFRGRDQLLAAFIARGRQSFGHRLVAAGQRGPLCLLEGVVEGLPDGGDGSFVSSLTVDGDGRIKRYVSFYCEPAVARVEM
jgi:ketosteroid isomerase-like protein